jgi:cytochrome c biogenesis protein CcmG/thiol:disulfide interchange protein DsbE
MGVLVRVRPYLLSLVALPLSLACRPVASAPRHLESMPDVAVTTLDDRATRISSALNHRPAVVALWATWCEACRAERPALERLERAAGPRGGLVVGVSVGEPSDVVREDLRHYPAPFLELVDEPFAFADALGVRALPAVFVVDREGRIVHSGGALDHAALAAFRHVLGVE